MKACPSCGRLYPADAGFCPVDGAELVSATQAPIPGDSDDRRVGQLLFERYQVRRVVADGGMGRVYEALDLSERRNVAIKILHPAAARDAIEVERCRREFEVSRLLPHAHIVEVLDFQPTPDGSFALIMEFLFGEELRAALAREHALAPARLVRMVSQIAIGLDKAHERSLVHRDLKPDNVFLCQTPDGDIVKILDFGSVKDRAQGAKKLTVVGTTIGSPFYMSPEQAQGLETLDHRADIWALGAITFEALTGRVPFEGPNGPSILMKILTQEAPLPSLLGMPNGERISTAVDLVLARAFKKLPSLRYETVGAFADALGAAHGLEGGHHVWAELPERVLAESLAKRPPSEAPATPQPRDVADSFFGEDDSLGEAAFLGVRPGPRLPAIPVASGQDSAGPDAHAAELAKPPAPHEPVRDDEGPLLIPGLGDPAGPRWLWWGVALVAALVVGAFIWVL